MLKAFREWLGPTRLRGLVGLLIVTGLTSTLLQIVARDEAWTTSAQTGLVLLFLGGAFVIFAGAMQPAPRARLAFTVLPALGALLIGALLPGLLPLFMGIALGWLFAAQLLMRSPENREYKQAIKAMRKKDYAKAIAQMSALIQREPKDAAHYGFRAQLYRLDGQLKRARRDYEKVMQLEPDSSLGANGLADLALEKGNLSEAREWAEKAYRAAPDDWVAGYNLGMILERQGEYGPAIKYLDAALGQDIPESRHRLLAKLWLARAHHQNGAHRNAREAAEGLRAEKRGLREWEIILDSEEGTPLRAQFQQDIRLAKAILAGREASDVFAAEG
ncbi:MAG: tetratricopeptide repeat protein [Anaerolineales bacterium]